ncbi:hypothetical protein OIU79_017673 [Salix purpurea]|uniref:Uncharacterized protein n=1 Tax=Salix purpurea TaxID=77065 RepID=A0A9Q0WZ14_SALPP|nr:hypothetical protein OIU79_017673 [Salix purpurea]
MHFASLLFCYRPVCLCFSCMITMLWGFQIMFFSNSGEYWKFKLLVYFSIGMICFGFCENFLSSLHLSLFLIEKERNDLDKFHLLPFLMVDSFCFPIYLF